MIWAIAACGPRTVSLGAHGKGVTRMIDNNELVTYSRARIMDQPLGIPNILRVSKEARQDGLRYFTLCFEKDIAHATAEDMESLIEWAFHRRTHAIYLNFDNDWFEYELSSGFLPKDTVNPCYFANIKHLRLSADDKTSQFTSDSIGALFPRLEQVDVSRQCTDQCVLYALKEFDGQLVHRLDLEMWLESEISGRFLKDTCALYTCSLTLCVKEPRHEPRFEAMYWALNRFLC